MTLQAPPLRRPRPRAQRRTPREARGGAGEGRARTCARRSPSAKIRWRYRIVANGFAVVLPETRCRCSRRCRASRRTGRTSPTRARPSASRHGAITQGPEVIGADKLWGTGLETAGNGIKIGIIDDGLDATHQYFDPTGLSYPPGLPEGPDAVHDAEGDRAARRSRRRRRPTRYAERAVRPGRVVPRHARRRDRGRRPRHAGRQRSRSPASRRTRTSATTRRSRSRRRASASTATRPRSPRRSRRPSPTG